jgi:hypothetical protein
MDHPIISLCVRCRRCDFRRLFYRAWVNEGIVDLLSYDIGSFREVFGEEGCGFCMLVRHTYRTAFGKNAIDRVLSWNTETSPRVLMTSNPLDMTYDLIEGTTDKIVLYADFGFYKNASNEVIAALQSERTLARGGAEHSHLPQIITLASGESNAENTGVHPGQVVEPDEIRWTMVKEWLSRCYSHHYSNLMSEGRRPEQTANQNSHKLRAIDVDQACIVKLPDDAPYVALSYVWGKDQRVKLKTGNIITLTTTRCFLDHENAPSRTIIDAMGITGRLGFRHLWVDALCIVQDDLDNIQANIESMQKIYSEAALTIVAAAGHNADFGIPGATKKCQRINHQMRVQIDGLTLSNRLESALDVSYWNSRGWTYQERVLSPRLLNFTTSQVSYQCSKGCNCEEQFQTTLDDPRQFVPLDYISQLDFETYNIFEVYALALSEYTRRSLTNAIDKIRAFDAILQVLKEPFQCDFLYGLPLTMFDPALLWIPAKRCVRDNKELPSWSWAGWTGQIWYDYREGDRLANLIECTAPQCTISLGRDGPLLCSPLIPTMDNLISGGWKREFDEEEFEITYRQIVTGKFDYIYPRVLRSTPRLNIHNSISSILTIKGKVAMFRLTSQHSGASFLEYSCNKGFHYKCNLAILDEDNHTAGTVIVDSHLIPQLQNQQHRFLAISRSTLSRQDDISWDQKGKQFRPWTEETTEALRAPDNKNREAYTEHFKDWVADLPQKPTLTLPLKSAPAKTIDRSSAFWASIDEELNREAFDSRYYSDKVLWPVFNILLLSREDNGIVERLGVGRIHVDAFKRTAQEEVILLG